MMTLGKEFKIIQNPGLGAVLLWQFSKAYSGENTQKAAPSLILLFYVLPMVWHRDTLLLIDSTNRSSSLRTLTGKFKESSNSKLDILLDLHPRAIRWRPKSLESLQLAMAAGLVQVTTDGKVVAQSQPPPINSLPGRIKTMLGAAEKLGFWLANTPLPESLGILFSRP